MEEDKILLIEKKYIMISLIWVDTSGYLKKNNLFDKRKEKKRYVISR